MVAVRFTHFITHNCRYEPFSKWDFEISVNISQAENMKVSRSKLSYFLNREIHYHESDKWVGAIQFSCQKQHNSLLKMHNIYKNILYVNIPRFIIRTAI